MHTYPIAQILQNARLLAAAPDLADALTRLMAAVINAKGPIDPQGPSMLAAYAALEKAAL